MNSYLILILQILKYRFIMQSVNPLNFLKKNKILIYLMFCVVIIYQFQSCMSKSTTLQQIIPPLEDLPIHAITAPHSSTGNFELEWDEQIANNFTVHLYESYNGEKWKKYNVSGSKFMQFRKKPVGTYRYMIQVCRPRDSSKNCRFINDKIKIVTVTSGFPDTVKKDSTTMLQYEIVSFAKQSNLLKQSYVSLKSYGIYKEDKRYNIIISPKYYIVEKSRDPTITTAIELSTKHTYFIDHTNKTFYSRTLLKQRIPRSTEKFLSFRRLNEHRWRIWGQTDYKEAKYLLKHPKLLLECWVLPNRIVSKQAISQYWQSIIPSIDERLFPPGLPSEIIVRSRQHPYQILLKLKLTGINTLKKTYSYPLKAYREIKYEMPYKMPRHPNGDPDFPDPHGGPRPPPQPNADFGFVFRQTFLNQLKDSLNRVLDTFYTFYPRIHTGQLRINWWEQLSRSLLCKDHNNAPDPEETERIIEDFKSLWLIKKIISKEKLVGLNSTQDPNIVDQKSRTGWNNFFSEYTTEENQYNAIIELVQRVVNKRSTNDITNDSLLINTIKALNEKHNSEAVTLFFIVAGAMINLDDYHVEGLFAEPRIDELKNPEFDELTKVRYLDMPSSVEGKWPQSSNSIVSGKIWDLEPKVTLNHPTINDISIVANSIRVELSIKQIWIDFWFETWPTTNAVNIIGAIIGGGINYILLSNLGYGYFNIDDAKLVFYLNRWISNDGTRAGLKFRVNKNASEMDTSAFALGINIHSDVLNLIGGLIVSLGDKLKWEILDEIQENFNSVQNENWLFWPQKIWHAWPLEKQYTTGNRIAIDNKSMRGLLSTEEGSYYDSPNGTGIIDSDKIDNLGYVFSKDYIVNWTQLLLDDFPASFGASADWEGDLNITLPSLDSLPQPTIGDDCVLNLSHYLPGISSEARELITPWLEKNCPVQTFSRHYRTKVRTESIRVDTPQEGVGTNAGTFNMHFKLDFSGIRNVKTPHVKIFWCEGKFPDDMPDWGAMSPWDVLRRIRSDTCPVFEYKLNSIVLKEFLKAEADVADKIIIGFNALGDYWLPEVDMGRKGNIEVSSVIIESLEPPFSGIDENVLRDYIQTIIRNAILDQFDKKKYFYGNDYLARDFLPFWFGIEGFSPILLTAFTFIRDSINEIPQYIFSDNLLYWQWKINEKFTQKCLE